MSVLALTCRLTFACAPDHRYQRRTVVPDDNDSALVAICHPWRHFSASFAAAACYRGLEAATRPLLLAVLVGGLGWGTGLAFFLFSFFMMVRGCISCDPS